MKIEELKKYTQITIKPIKDIEKYRGFYFQLEDGYVVANFCSNPKEGLNVQYNIGFELEYGSSVTEHLFNKLEEGKILTKNEKDAFYEKVNLFHPYVQNMGEWYDFKEVLHKVRGVSFYTISEKISKREVKIFNEHQNGLIDIEELAS